MPSTRRGWRAPHCSPGARQIKTIRNPQSAISSGPSHGRRFNRAPFNRAAGRRSPTGRSGRPRRCRARSGRRPNTRTSRRGARGQLGAQDFDDDGAAEPLVGGFVDRALPARAELLRDAVIEERPANHRLEAVSTQRSAFSTQLLNFYRRGRNLFRPGGGRRAAGRKLKAERLESFFRPAHGRR